MFDNNGNGNGHSCTGKCYNCKRIKCRGNGNGNGNGNGGNGGPGTPGNGGGNGDNCDCPLIDMRLDDLEDDVEKLVDDVDDLEAKNIVVDAVLEAITEITIPDLKEEIEKL